MNLKKQKAFSGINYKLSMYWPKPAFAADARARCEFVRSEHPCK